MSYLSIYLNIRYSTDPDPPYSHFRYTTYTTGPNSITINFFISDQNGNAYFESYCYQSSGHTKEQ